MLINATQSEELRIAVVDGQKLLELEIEFSLRPERKGNIYKALITRIEPSLDAVFVDYGEERHGFLPYKEIAKPYYKGSNLTVGQELIVQVVKDERGNKGAALTTYISLAGRYIVLMPMSPRAGGVSRRADANTRNEARETLELLQVPEDMGIIIRTAGIGRDAQDLTWDLNYLRQLWSAISEYSQKEHKAELIYQESSLVIRAIRDYFQSDINEILVDTEDVYNQALGFISYVMPAYTSRVKHYKDDTPLFSRFQVEHQIETAYSRTVQLPSGGSIVIDRTEALVAIDINSSRSTRGQDVEQTAYTTNMEAAEEIARQMRLRDLGGLIVVDFIDMESANHQRDVENKMRDCVRSDRARIQLQKLSRFGLMEISRQRLQPSLGESSNVVCPRCGGAGNIRSTDSFALQAIREIESEALKENTGRITIQVPVEIASYLLNEKRTDIQRIEIRSGANIIVVPNKYLETPKYQIERLRHDELNEISDNKTSSQLVEENKPTADTDNRLQKTEKPVQKPKVKSIMPDQPAPEVVKAVKNNANIGLWGWIKSLFSDKPLPSVDKPITPPVYNRNDRDRYKKRGNRDLRDVRDLRDNRDNKDSKVNKEISAEKERRSDDKDRQDLRNKNRKDAVYDKNRTQKPNQNSQSANNQNAEKNNKGKLHQTPTQVTSESKNVFQQSKNPDKNINESHEKREPREQREPREKDGNRSRYLGRNRDNREARDNKSNIHDNKNKEKIIENNNSESTLYYPQKHENKLPLPVSEPIVVSAVISEKETQNKLDDFTNVTAVENKVENLSASGQTFTPVVPQILSNINVEKVETSSINEEVLTPPKPEDKHEPLVINLPPELKMVETINTKTVEQIIESPKLGREIKNQEEQITIVALEQVETKNN